MTAAVHGDGVGAGVGGGRDRAFRSSAGGRGSGARACWAVARFAGGGASSCARGRLVWAAVRAGFDRSQREGDPAEVLAEAAGVDSVDRRVVGGEQQFGERDAAQADGLFFEPAGGSV